MNTESNFTFHNMPIAELPLTPSAAAATKVRGITDARMNPEEDQ
jgi:hypothetical protein